jgi:hypothetical protein
MASINVIIVGIVILGIIYMYINSRQYLVREGFGPSVSWPGGVVSSPPFSVTGPSGSGYRW